MTGLIESQRRRLLRHGFIFTSAYLGLAANIFSAILDLPGPASHPGVAPPMPQAAVFFMLLAIVVPTTLISFGLVMYGMRGESEPG
jgi:hypothetical protein